MTRVLLALILLLVVSIPGGMPLAHTAYQEPAPGSASEAVKAKALEVYGELPLLFIENQGQLDAEVRYYVKAAGQTIYLTDDGMVFDLTRYQREDADVPDPADRQAERLVFGLDFVGASESPTVQGRDRGKAVVNYFIGNDPQKWYADIRSYKEVVYQSIYPGIDLRLYGNAGLLEYEFIVAPGADVSDIALAYSGIDSLAIEGGELVAGTPLGETRQSQPYIYQQAGDQEVAVDGGFRLAGGNTYGFEVAAYNASYPIIIDPALLYSTYLGGVESGDPNYGYAIAVDASGCAYVTGYTQSDDFPARNAYDDSPRGSSDAFVTKLDATKSGDASLIYSTYLGGSGDEYGYGIAVDSSGSAYVTGHTQSGDFPTRNAYDDSHGGSFDAFVAKIDTTQSGDDSLVYSTYLGGSGYEYGYGIAVDSSGSAYVTGSTSSHDFPTLNPYQSANAGGSDAFVAKINTTQSGDDSLVYSTYLGGSGYEYGYGIAVDSSGSAYVTGSTSSHDFPTLNPYQSANAGGSDAFVAKIDTTKSGDQSLVYSTYVGGSGWDQGRGVAVDSSGSAYVTGHTQSGDFPTRNAYDDSLGGGSDAFATKIDTTKFADQSLIYSTYLGGSSGDSGYAIAIDATACAYITGSTWSHDFPARNAYDDSPRGSSDAFVTKLDATKSGDASLIYSTYLGGGMGRNYNDFGIAVAADSSGCAYVTGATHSTAFPIRNAYQATGGATMIDAFVTKIDTTKSGDASLVYSTYLGGSDHDGGGDIAVDSSGCAYVTGITKSTDFPTLNPYQAANAGGCDAFITKLSASGSALVYSTYLGGSARDGGGGSIAIDSSGCAYVSGTTASTDFPTLNAYQDANAGQSDAFITKLNASGSALVYSTYLGGSATDTAVGVALDPNGCAYVAGVTTSIDFPTHNPFQTDQGGIDLFVTKLNASGSALAYSTYLGGSGYDGYIGSSQRLGGIFGDIAVDRAGCAYVAGLTTSTDFPTHNAYDGTLHGPRDAFVTRLSASGTALDYSTYLGGSDEDYAMDIAADASGYAYVTGVTKSTDFPTRSPLQVWSGAYPDGDPFVSKVDTTSSGTPSLMFSTYLGGTTYDGGYGIAVDSSGSAYVTGFTKCGDFPTKNGYQPTRPPSGLSQYEAFLAKVDTSTVNNPPNIPSNPSPQDGATAVSANVTLSWAGGDPDPGDSMTYDVYFGRCALGYCYLSPLPLVSPGQAPTTYDPPGALLDNTRYYWKIVARDNHGAEAFGPLQWGFFTTSTPLSVTTEDATNIEAESTGANATFRATLNGNLASLGSGSTAAVWFYWGEDPSAGVGTCSYSTSPQTVDTTGPFSADLSGLQPGIIYWFGAVAAPFYASGDSICGAWRTFTTGVATVTGTGAVTFSPDAGAVTEAAAVAEATLPTAGKPDVTFPHGLFSFTISDIPVGSSVTVTLTLPSSVPQGIEYWKYDAVQGWLEVTSLLGDDDGDNVLTLTLTDGGPGDGDGVANGTIVDPGGPGVPAATPPGPGGGGGGGWKLPTHRTMTVDTPGRRTTARISSSGELLESVTLADDDNRFTLKLDKGAKITCAGGKAPERMELKAAGAQPPLGHAAIVGAAYEVNAYAHDYSSAACPVTISPSGRMGFAYAPDELPENTTSLTIAYYDADKGWVELETTYPGVTEAGVATADASHLTSFALLARLAPPAKFKVSNLTINPSQAQANEEVKVSITVTNTGGSSGNYDAVLKVNGQVEKTKRVSVAPGVASRAEFSVLEAEAGTYTVTIGGQTAGLTVLGADSSGAPSTGAVIAFIIMGIVALVTVVVILAFRRGAW